MSKTETWTYPTAREILVAYWNEMNKRCEQMAKWKKPPTQKRIQKELNKIISKYEHRVLAAGSGSERQEINLTFKP